MKTVKLKWEEGRRWYRKFLSVESIEEVKKLLISELWEELVDILKVEDEGISVWWYHKKIWRQKCGIITHFKKQQEEFDFSKVSKKYLEFKRIFEQNKAWEQERKNRRELWSNFCKTISVDGVTVWQDYEWKYSLKIDWFSVKPIIDDGGLIKSLSYGMNETQINITFR